MTQRREIARGMDEEFRFHVEMETLDRLSRGEAPREARRAALRDFGGVERYRAESRDALGLSWLDDLRADTRIALRGFRRRPAFAAVIVAILGIGIGANAAVFSVLDRVLIRPLPYPEGDALVMLWQATPTGKNWVSAPDYVDWSSSLRVFERMAAFTPDGLNVAGPSSAESIAGAAVSASFFDVLRVSPAMGRAFTAAEAARGSPGVIVLSDALWRRGFGADPAIVGRTVDVDGESATVLGVMPPDFVFPSGTDAWVPLRAFSQDWHARRGIDWLQVVARIAPGVSSERLQSDLDRVAANLASEYPDTNAEDRIDVVPLREQLYGDLRLPLYLLMGAVGFVLLMVCASVAGLLLARATTRRTETAVRLALGSGRGRLARSLLAESVVLALAGGVVGALLAGWGRQLLVSLSPVPLVIPGAAVIDARVLAFAVLVTIVTAVLFGAVPAMLASRTPLGTVLRAARSGDVAGTHLVRRALVVGQIAIAIVLATGGLLLGRSLMRLQGVDTGFAVEHRLTARIPLTAAYYPEDEDRISFFTELQERLAASAVVDGVAIGSQVPLSGSGITFSFELDGLRDAVDEELLAGFRMAGPGYFDVMGIRLEGRDFDSRDVAGARLVAAIDRTLADRYFPDRNPIGQRIYTAGEWRDIVGVVGAVRQSALDAAPRPTIYLPYSQRTAGSMYVVLRGRSDTPPASLLLDAVRDIDRNQPVALVQPMAEYVTHATGQPRFLASVIGGFSVVALFIAALGVYGIVAFAVSRRTGEFAVRMALGAQPAAVTRTALIDGLVLLGFGLPIGIGAALVLGRFLENTLFEVQPADPFTFAAVPTVLALVTLAAGWLPARRASRTDPARVLR